MRFRKNVLFALGFLMGWLLLACRDSHGPSATYWLGHWDVHQLLFQGEDVLDRVGLDHFWLELYPEGLCDAEQQWVGYNPITTETCIYGEPNEDGYGFIRFEEDGEPANLYFPVATRLEIPMQGGKWVWVFRRR